MEIRAIITGSTGMVGEGVLHECLQHPDVKEVLVINRRPCGVRHPRLKEIIHENFYDMLPVAAKLHGYNACYFCLGVSSVGMKEEAYKRVTYDLTMEVAKTRFFPQSVSTLAEVGQAMINVTRYGCPKPVLEVKDILTLAHHP